ncbi:terpene cyclase/mutase family protein [bacterium]|nr:terpene cyclase/mutase family protein [candidate division CSSED10-310 bacterium]
MNDMPQRFLLCILLAFLAGTGAMAISIDPNLPAADHNLSLKKEIQASIHRGLAWLQKNQDAAGHWSSPDYPAITALALCSFMGDPSHSYPAAEQPFIRKGLDCILKNVQPDGGIYVKDLAAYNTSVSMMALVAAGDPDYEPVLRNARRFLIGLQDDFGEKRMGDSPYDGGIGYGGRYDHSDMSNTVLALEALYYTKYLNNDLSPKERTVTDLNWKAAIQFIQRCQNLPSHNDQAWASDDPANKGGFVYFPGDSKAGEMTTDSGKTALRSYGSMSYAGLLSYIYADLDRDDPRVTAVVDWLRKSYTLEENPGMGQEGLYYYYHTMVKALALYGMNELTLVSGKTVDWRRELALKLFNLQQPDGSWMNDNGRWWEKDPVLVTSYVTLALEVIYRGL